MTLPCSQVCYVMVGMMLYLLFRLPCLADSVLSCQALIVAMLESTSTESNGAYV